MRFLKYLQTISNVEKDDAIFRSVSIDLVDKPTNYKNIVEEKSEDAIELVNNINKELKKFYKGSKYRFDFITEESPIDMSCLKLKNQRYNWLKKICFNFNDKLASIQTNYEKQIKDIK